jgi:hypothetical protein
MALTSPPQQAAVRRYRAAWRRLQDEAKLADEAGWHEVATDLRRLAAVAHRAAFNEAHPDK